MNILFVSHCDFRSNSAIQIYNIAQALTDLGEHCVVCIPGPASNVDSIGSPRFQVRSFDEAQAGVVFPNGGGPDLIHAWTPREHVRKFTERLVRIHGCPYLVHLEDNEEVILEVELRATWAELLQLSPEHLDAVVPQSRAHPLRYPEFMAGSAGVTVLIDRLLEFKPPHLPELVFWPGFDEECLHLPGSDTELRRRLGIGPDVTVLVYNGNIHATNAAEVRSLFLAVQALRRTGRRIVVLKAGWNQVSPGWLQEAIDTNAVIDLGFVPRSAGLWDVLASADILVQPGRADRFNDYRFPSKLPEFFASGRPVILPQSNVGLAVRDGVEALVLARGDAIEIAQKLETLMDDPALASEIGEAGKNFALSHLSWSKNVAALNDYYAFVLGQPSVTSAVKPICFYLPQFHPTKENDEFWGKGFTEWTNVARAQPNFEGHYQPQLPADLGFYDLRLPEVLCRQAQLAAEYGIYGFCFYYYWFGGRRVLDGPLNTMLESGEPDFPFCICWANESWTRNWDGAPEQVLIQQEYAGDSCERFIRDVIPILRDRRYIRAGDAPMLLVYRADQLPDAPQVASRWRQICAEAGIPKIHLCAVQSFGIEDPRPYGFDAAVEFPPHTKRALLDKASFPGISSDFEGYLEDYPEIVRNQIAKPWPGYPLYRGVMPAWDNTARRGKKAHILVHSSNELYEEWLTTIIHQTLEHPSQEPFVFINAWNEWSEGAYLEPDQRFGHARLKATRNALRRSEAEPPPSGKRPSKTPGTPRIIPAAQAEEVAQPERLNGFHPGIIARLYSDYPLKALSYGTARDYCDSVDHLSPLAVMNGDMKDLQRPWMLKAILSKLHGKSRLLEIGAGEPLVADLLQLLGHEVWIVDPYDGSGNGPTEYDAYRKRYPKLKFLRSVFNDQLRGIKDGSIDCIYSISVLEHIPCGELAGVFAGMNRFLKPSGVTIHAIDHVHKGNGAEQHLTNLRRMMQGFGFRQEDLDQLLATMADDVETYYLSAESHNRWRGSVPYDQFPMRVCVSIQVVREAGALER